jgi:hypothetical protein
MVESPEVGLVVVTGIGTITVVIGVGTYTVGIVVGTTVVETGVVTPDVGTGVGRTPGDDVPTVRVPGCTEIG